MKYVYQDILSRHGDDAFLSIRVVAVYVQLLLFCRRCVSTYPHTHLGDMSSHSRLQNFFSSRAFINVVILLRCSNAPFEKSGSSFNWKHPKRHLEVEEFEVFAARLNEFQILKALAANRGCGSRRACRQLRRYHERTKDWTCFLPGARSRKCFQTTVQGSKFGSALHE